MPFCPNDECPNYAATHSRAEFVEGVASCSDCGTALVATAPVEGVDDEPWRWVVLDRFNKPSEAHLARSLLESEGIPVALADDHLNEINPLLGPAVGWIRLLVPAEMAPQARALLTADESAAIEDLVRAAPDRFSRPVAIGDGEPRRRHRPRLPLWVWLLWGAMLVVAIRMALWQAE